MFPHLIHPISNSTSAPRTARIPASPLSLETKAERKGQWEEGGGGGSKSKHHPLRSRPHFKVIFLPHSLWAVDLQRGYGLILQGPTIVRTYKNRERRRGAINQRPHSVVPPPESSIPTQISSSSYRKRPLEASLSPRQKPWGGGRTSRVWPGLPHRDGGKRINNHFRPLLTLQEEVRTIERDRSSSSSSSSREEMRVNTKKSRASRRPQWWN